MTSIEQLEQYLDRQLPEAQVQQLELDLQQDAELQKLLNSLQLIRETVRIKGISDQIRQIHTQYKAENEVESPEEEEQENGRETLVKPMPIRRSYTWGLRIAASLLVGVMTYQGYELASLTGNQYYENKFIPYQLPVTRGQAVTADRLDALYASGDYAATARQFSTLAVKKPGDYFLAGMASLQEKKFAQAISLFSMLRHSNAQHSERYFVQETDYYLALAYVGANRIEEALDLFNAIRNDPQHNYYQTITDVDLLKLKLLRARQ